jgi:hypothetical protein
MNVAPNRVSGRVVKTSMTVPGSGFQVPGSEDDTVRQIADVTKTDSVPEAHPDPTTKSQEPKLTTQNSQLQLKTQQLQLKTQDSRLKTISEGKHLFQLAREEYGNPYLWVLIYKENQDVIKDPDQAIIGKEVKIPALEGMPDKLSHNDSLEVAEGYRLVYEFYQAKGDPRANDFNRAYQKYLFQ